MQISNRSQVWQPGSRIQSHGVDAARNRKGCGREQGSGKGQGHGVGKRHGGMNSAPTQATCRTRTI